MASEVWRVVSSLWEMPSVEESTADFTKERLIMAVSSEIERYGQVKRKANIKAEAALSSVRR